MIESLDVNKSTDLLNEFLGQQSGEPVVIEPTPVINDGGTPISETIVAPTPNINSNSTELSMTNEIPADLLGEVEEENGPEGDAGEPDNTGSSEPTGSYSFKALAGYLSEEGIIDFEDGEGIEDTPDVLFDSVKKTIDSQIQAYKDSIPDKAKQLIEYLEKGGSVDSYLEAIQKPFDITKVDLTSESDQEKVVREYLRYQEYSPEEIDETIKDYKDSLILDKQSKVATKQLQKYFEKSEQALIERQEAEATARQEQMKQYISTVNTTIDTAETLAGLPLTTKEKLAFKQYLLATDKEGKTQYAREVAENPVQTQLELAFLKFMKYDFSKAVKAGETNAAKKYKDIFKANETSIKTGKSREEITTSKSDLDAFASFRFNK